MRILITGATGFVGRKLTVKLLEMGHEIIVLTRDRQKAESLFSGKKVTPFTWTNNLEMPPAEALSGINGVINLMGENIGAHRWSNDQKRKLKESRVDATKNLIKQIEQTLNSPLEFFLQASAIGIYPKNSHKVFNEDSHPGFDYLAELCKEWEEPTNDLSKTKRKAIIRTGVVLEKTDGALKKMLPPFQLGLGGPIGDGDQMMSWIHLDDLVEIYTQAVTDEKFSGIINAVAPTPVNNFDFTKALGQALHRPTLFPVPTLPLKLAFGEMSTIILDSQAVVSKKLDELNFHFKYPSVNQALNAIFGK